MNTESRKITAKFTGRCTKCNGVVPSGTQCFWSKSAGVSHISCPTPSVDKIEDDIVRAEVANVFEIDETGERYWNDHRDDKRVTVTAGVYKKDGHIYVVKPNKLKTKVYAKEIIESPARMTENGAVADFTTVYRSGVVFQLTEADRWNLADAKDFLTRFSKCIVCGRHLKAAKSVAGSIGPICAKYFADSQARNCDDKPVVKLAQVKEQATMDTDDDVKRAAIATEIAISDSQAEAANVEPADDMLASDAINNAKLVMSDDQRALLAELKRLNAKSRAWIAEDPANRWSGILTEDIAYWSQSGINSVADLDAMQAAEDAKERRKASYDMQSCDDVEPVKLAQLLAHERSTTVTSGEMDEALAILRERYTPHNGFGNSTNLFD